MIKGVEDADKLKQEEVNSLNRRIIEMHDKIMSLTYKEYEDPIDMSGIEHNEVLLFTSDLVYSVNNSIVFSKFSTRGFSFAQKVNLKPKDCSLSNVCSI